MAEEGTTKEQLLKKIKRLEERVSELEKMEIEHKQVEDKLRMLTRAVEQSPSVVTISDTKGNIEYVNSKFTQLTGYIPEEIVGKSSRILKSGEKTPEEYKELWEAITSGHEWRGEFHNKKKNGELYWESASISPIKDQNGQITHYVKVAEDITARKEAENELAKKIHDLKVFQKVAIGRELKMVELKVRIHDLEEQLKR